MPKTAVILQSNYLPWKGYFDLVRTADVFVVFDCVQYTRSDWRNRNAIKAKTRLQWLTIPVKNRFRDRTSIEDVEIAQPSWAVDHLRIIDENYSTAAAFEQERPWLGQLLLAAAEAPRLSVVNVMLLREICNRIGIDTPIVLSSEIMQSDMLLSMDRTERLVRLCKALGANAYLSGPAAQSYMN